MGRTLAVLGCSGCGAPLALGTDDSAVCSACGRSTPIPAEHRALRDAAGFDAQARAEAEAALHSFDRPPGLFMRAVAAIAGLPFAAVWILFGVPLFFVDLGLAVGLAALLPAVLSDRSEGTGPEGQAPAPVDRARTRVLLVDALVYANLGLLDAALSHVFVVGGFALLNYAYLFVNAALMVPSAAATVVGLRLSAGGDPGTQAQLRRWAVIGGVVCTGLVVAVGLLLGWAPVARQVDAAVGWSLAASIGGLVLWSAPFAGLRLANTIGRQFVIATDPRRVLAWDLGGLAGRAVILGLGAAVLGLAASPIGLAFAELLQVGAWWRVKPARPIT